VAQISNAQLMTRETLALVQIGGNMLLRVRTTATSATRLQARMQIAHDGRQLVATKQPIGRRNDRRIIWNTPNAGATTRFRSLLLGLMSIAAFAASCQKPGGGY
jgi:hypothetical protein